MKRITLILPLLLAASVFAGNLTQYSSYTGLLKRLFDGFVSFEEVVAIGNHGIGTTDQLNGELIILDGVPYRVNFEGQVEKIAPEETTPYVTLAKVEKKDAFVATLPAGTEYDELDDVIKSVAKDVFTENFPYAIRLEGTFAEAKLRSIPKLEKPYISLTEVAKNQNVFEFKDHGFTLIGFWNPSYAEAFNPPQWHIHGLDSELKAGGHALKFKTGSDVKVYLWKLTGFDIRVPDTVDFAKADFSEDLSKEVLKVNRDKD